ncbi:uncharacterized protein LOC127700350 [Mytilus californianus]|uniref:uncharacterized protein LOC127700350 n=1 Tax=Mytilus californianus TaxID=6549 RepID=UPI002247631E|nr:uncharacterized protein LOC127700350 [Mytilus californianus]
MSFIIVGFILMPYLIMIKCDICSTTIGFECHDSSMTVFVKNSSVQVFIEPVSSDNNSIYVSDNYTVPKEYIEPVKLFSGYMVKAMINKTATVDCYLICKNKSKNINSNLQFSYPLAIQRNEVGGVDMRLRENRDESSSEISHAYLGDIVYMFIKYTGKTNYTIMPTSCTAYSGSIIQSAKYLKPLWDIHSCNSSTTNYFSPIERKDAQTVFARIKVFTFGNSTDVTFACHVRICSACTLGESCSSIKMKRKGHKFNQELTPGRTLKIAKRPLEKQRSAGQRISHNSSVCLYVLVTWSLLMFLE